MRVTRPPEVDWFRILVELERLGVCNGEAAARINVPRATLRRWKSGSVPNFEDGLALVTLWMTERKKAQLRHLFSLAPSTKEGD